MFPEWRHVESPHGWNGLLSLAPDLTPGAAPIEGMPGAFTGLSHHGNGVAMRSYAGALLADPAMDHAPEHPYPQILRTPPRRWPLGVCAVRCSGRLMRLRRWWGVGRRGLALCGRSA